MKYRIKTYTYQKLTGIHQHHSLQVKKWWGWKTLTEYPYGPQITFFGEEGLEKCKAYIKYYQEGYPKVTYDYVCCNGDCNQGRDCPVRK
jgi:hypothetical protein